MELNNIIKALKEKNKLLESVVDLISDGAFLIDKDIHYTFINPGSGRIVGHDPENWIGKRAGNHLHPDDRKTAAEAFLDALQGRSREIEIRVAGSDDGYRYLSVKLCPLEWKGSTHVLGVANDLTILKQREEALRKIEKEQRTLLDSVPALIFFKDKENRLGRVNASFAREAGASKEELEGRSAFEVASDRMLAEAYWQDDKEVIRSGKPKRNIIEPHFRDNNRWFQTDKIPYVDDSGEIIGIIGFAVEVTEKRMAESLLRESEARYRTLIETMNDGIAVQDDNDVITYVNDAVCRMTGYSREEVIGNRPGKFLDDMNATIVKEQTERRKRGETAPYELEMTNRNGEKLQVLMSPRSILDVQGSFKGSFAVITDITRLKEIEASLVRRERELESKNKRLEEMNAALNVLLKKREEDKKVLEEAVMSNISKLIKPYISKLKRTKSSESRDACLRALEKNLEEIISPFSQTLSASQFGLTPAELQVANLTKQGKPAKEIAELLNLSPKTIEVHRHHIRRKLGIRNKKVNLRSHLLSLR